jgi:hypothetical protein
MYAIEVLVARGKPTEQWCLLRASEDNRPYLFASADEAERVMYMCYPKAEHYGFVRIVPYTGGGVKTDPGSLVEECLKC